MVEINHLAISTLREKRIRWDLHTTEITFAIEKWVRMERKWTNKKWAAFKKKEVKIVDL